VSKVVLILFGLTIGVESRRVAGLRVDMS